MNRTQVAIIGGGPAGTLLSHVLRRHGVESVVLERRSKEYVLGRIRAGVLEQGSADILREYGLGDRMDREGQAHDGVYLAYRGGRFRVDFRELAGSSVMIYGQTQVQKDLYDVVDAEGGVIIDEVEDVRLHGLTDDRPAVTYVRQGVEQRMECDFVAGCDGSHGVSSSSIPDIVTYERNYPFGWLGILSETPPIAEELIYANHPRGFALCSMRNPMLSRYYVQCDIDADVSDWSDDRFWEELAARLPDDAVTSLVTGPSIDKSITPLRSSVAEPMSHGRLFLAGDAAHIVPPTGAKGLNLAISDVVYLSRALVDFYASGATRALDAYSDTALARVWKAVRFSWWMTTLMHRFEEDGSFGPKVQEAELEYLSESPAARTAMAENYIGLPL